MSIRIYDSGPRQVVSLEPRDPARVAMYVCGPTVYNYVHIGNARTFVWFDFIRRYLTYRGLDVTYVMNYTDVDDKIIERSKLEGIPAEGVATKYAQAFEADMSALGAEPADVLARATDHVEDMITAVEGLIERGVAYESEGDVFFSVESFSGYGKLSGRSPEDMRAGERIDPSDNKRSPLDFALWKAAKEGEPSWSSPWGPGRPGWHIECSVMSTKYLGMGFDIHGGGRDLIFPHHENELAQAEALAGEGPFVRYWVHAGLVQMEAEKMSKSLGNVVLARDALERYAGEAVRYWALMGSYRTQAVFSDDSLADAAQGYERWKTFLQAGTHALDEEGPSLSQAPRRPVGAESFQGPSGDYVRRFIAAMDDDFNSSEAVAAIHDLVREGNKEIEEAQRGDRQARSALGSLLEAFVELTYVMGFRFRSEAKDSELVGGLVDYLLDLRQQARDEKAFDRADAIRARLSEVGVVLEDTPAGTRWRLASGERI
jgi:cysteinyl-tRNA synthetase